MLINPEIERIQVDYQNQTILIKTVMESIPYKCSNFGSLTSLKKYLYEAICVDRLRLTPQTRLDFVIRDDGNSIIEGIVSKNLSYYLTLGKNERRDILSNPDLDSILDFLIMIYGDSDSEEFWSLI